jgi:hypothetical protein
MICFIPVSIERSREISENQKWKDGHNPTAHRPMSADGRKADLAFVEVDCLLMTHNGHRRIALEGRTDIPFKLSLAGLRLWIPILVRSFIARAATSK